MKDRIMNYLGQNGYSISLGLLLIVAVFLMMGCSTVAGLGRDVTTMAEWTKDKMSDKKEVTVQK